MDVFSVPRLKYLPEHARFLMETISHGHRPGSPKFTLVIQILNLLLRAETKARLPLPLNLMDSLKQYLLQDRANLQSPAVISNVVWLVGRCIQMARDRQTLMQRLAESQLLECCLGSPEL